MRDGETYFMIYSSFEYYPGLLIWKSKDLINQGLVFELESALSIFLLSKTGAALQGNSESSKKGSKICRPKISCPKNKSIGSHWKRIDSKIKSKGSHRK